MRRHSILILGGTTEGHAMAAALIDHPLFAPVSSLAAQGDGTRLPPGEVRVGGFGGFLGLAHYLADAEIAAVIDATHPFAARMGWNAATACAVAGRPLLRLERPPWRPGPDDRWHFVETWEEGARTVRDLGARRVLLVPDCGDLTPFAALSDVWFLLPAGMGPDPLPPFEAVSVLETRGPVTEAGEIALLRERRIEAVACRDDGGPEHARLAAARALGLPVILRRRPARPFVRRVGSIERALTWLDDQT